MRGNKRRAVRRASTSLVALASLAGLAWTPWSSASEAKGVAVLVGGMLVAIFGVRQALSSPSPRGPHVQRHALAWLTITSVAWSILSGLWSPSGPSWIDAAASLGALLFAAAAASLGPRSAVLVFVHSAMLLAVANSACAVFQALARRPIVGVSGNPDWLGLLLCVALPAHLSLLLRAFRRRRLSWVRGGHVLLLGLHMVAMILARSRVGWLALGLGSVAWAMSTRARNASSLTRLAAVLPPDAAGAFHDAPWMESLKARAWIARHSLRAFLSAPWLGHGAGGFGPAYLEAQAETLAPLTPAQAARSYGFAGTAHSEVLQVLVEQGLVGAALWGGTALLFLRGAWRKGLGFFRASAVVLVVEAWAEIPLHQPAIVLLAGLMGGCLVARPRARAGARTLFPLATCFALAAMALPFSARILASRCIFHLSDEKVGASRRIALANALRLAPNNVDAALALAQAHADEGHPARAHEVTLRAAERMPSVATEIALGNTSARLDRWAEASQHYRRALWWDPGSLKGRVNAATAARHLGKLDEARAHLDAAKSLAPYALTVRDLEEQLIDDEMNAVTEDAKR